MEVTAHEKMKNKIDYMIEEIQTLHELAVNNDERALAKYAFYIQRKLLEMAALLPRDFDDEALEIAFHNALTPQKEEQPHG